VIAVLALLLVGWDGADFRKIQDLPNLHRLHVQPLQIVGFTQTKPSWASQLTGDPWYVTGVVTNTDFQEIPRGRTVFEVLSRQGISSAWVSGKCRRKGQLCAIPGYPFIHVPEVSSHFASGRATRTEITDRCLASTASFTFCHYQWPDVVGHAYGGDSPEYMDALRANDVDLGRLLDSGKWDAVLVTSDHGFEMGEPTVDPLERFAPRGAPFGHQHLHQSQAVSAASFPIRQGTERDVFATVLGRFGIPDDRPESRDLAR
jgi:predicted AlkP superfamily pyrophosphatase or phosphodiesterase